MQFTGSRFIVTGVSCLIAYISVTSQIFVFLPWLMLSSLRTTMAVLVPFNLGVFFICWNYYLACTTDPGSPPKRWGEPEVVDKSDGHATARTTALEDKKTSLKDRSAITTITATGDLKKEQDQAETAIQAQHDQDATTAATDTQADRAHMNLDHRPLDPASLDTSSEPVNAATSTTSTITAPSRKAPRPRYCRHCKGFKPPRSHHCRVCKRCVLKMDHHCPWINNCVGHFNYGHFLRFVTWVTITTGMCMALLLLRIWDAMHYERFYLYHPELAPTKVQIVFLIVNIFVDGGVLLAVGTLCIYHLWSLVKNTSTIEVWEIEKVEKMIKSGKMHMTKFPYDLGCRRNYRQVLGPNLWMCLWPQTMLGSGLEYEVMDDKDAALLWPPREYQTSKRQDHEYVSQYSTTYRRHLRRRPRPRPRPQHVEMEDDDEYHPREGRTNDIQNSTVATSASFQAYPPEYPPEYRPHVRRGSEGWIVQDLTIQERAALYDLQYAYELQQQQQQQLEGQQGLAYPSPQEDDDEADFHEGLSDHEHEDAFGRPTYYDDEGEEEDDEDYTEDEEEEEEDVSEYDDDYFDERNPYLEYDDEEEEEEEEEQDDDEDSNVQRNEFPAYPTSGSPSGSQRRNPDRANKTGRTRALDSAHDAFAEDMDEVSLMGRDRHMIGKFFSNGAPTIRPEDLTTTDEDEQGEEYGGEIDEWDEGEGLATGCVPTRPEAAATTLPKKEEGEPHPRQKPIPQKTLYEQIAERQETMKKKKKKSKK